MLNIEISYTGGYPLIRLEGNLDALGASVFEKEVRAIEENHIFRIIDFLEVPFVSSAGLRVLLAAEKTLREREGNYILVNLSQNITHVLEMAGLARLFRQAANTEEAAFTLIPGLKQASGENRYQFDGKAYAVRKMQESASAVYYWEDPDADGSGLQPVTLEELGLAIGKGCISTNIAEAAASQGDFISTGHFFGFRPAAAEMPADFIVTERPAGAQAYLSEAFSLEGTPYAQVSFRNEREKPLALGEVMRDLFTLLGREDDQLPPMTGCLVLASGGYPADREAAAPVKGLVAFGFGFFEPALHEPDGEKFRVCFGKMKPLAAESHYYQRFNGVLLSGPAVPSGETGPEELLRSCLRMDQVEDILTPDQEFRLTEGKIFLYLPDHVSSAGTKRLKIEKASEFDMPEGWEVLIRNTFRDASRVILSQLHGGFSAKTFQVASFDREGRRMLPTVLKIANAAIIHREEDRYNEYVRKFILNNSTVIMATDYFMEWGGLRYNFLGITGSDSKLRWLTHIYKERPVEALIPLFDRIFKDILKPWYGQPKLEHIRLYAEHNPLLTFFANIFDEAEKVLGISPEDQYIDCPELERKIVNPYWFLKYGYPEREKQATLYYRCVSHGDLNMQNILLDEMENIYIIDFSETEAKNAVSDFARLEPIFKIEMTGIAEEKSLNEILEFEEALMNVRTLGEKPEYVYRGTNPNFRKAYEMVCLMRKYADTVTIFETDLIPYLLVLLEWTLPVVVYYGLSLNQKRYSALSCGLICERILELEKA